MSMAHIIVKGAGIADVSTAYALKDKLETTHKITMVHEIDYVQFLPSNIWVRIGWPSRSAITFENAWN
ncbi:hypothetical protein OQJ26_04250 [Legionella sp. PATHC038]|uniref:hypothetical protein n=1 Tax=Legionella sheltonii TaxID=2992041 RepID=UPI00224349DE|nr:hypothetical protein [Legionella sp. PATHC038]MCW8398002.1 hypothetical protein [Legionella sp. PATHC038]